MISTNQNQILFRENAIKHLNDIQEDNELLQGVGPRNYLWLLAGLLLVLTVFLWMIFGRITLEFSVNGILMPVEAKAIPIIVSQSGFISQLFVKNGDTVRQGDKLVQMDDPIFNLGLNQAREEKIYREKILKDAVNQYEIMRKTMIEKLKREKFNLAEQIASHEIQCKIMFSLYKKKKALFQKKYLTINDIAKSKSEYLAEADFLQKLKSEFLMLEKNRMSELTSYHDTIQKYDTEYRKSNDAYEYKLSNSNQFSLTAPAPGIILEQRGSVGEYINSGNLFITLLSSVKINEYEVLAFVTQSVIKELTKDMKATIYLDTLKRHETMNGIIREISVYPISKAALYDHIGNRDLMDSFFMNGPPYLVVIQLLNPPKSHVLKMAAGMVVKIIIYSLTCTPFQRMTHQCGAEYG